MTDALHLSLDRTAKLSLAEQIRIGIGSAIREGQLQPGARLPSWRDLAAQLGVARGTVRVAYERLIDTQLIVASGPAGTHVADHPPAAKPAQGAASEPPLAGMFQDFSTPPGMFQMGVPAQDAFPFKHWSRLMARAARATAASPVSYPDPRGEPELRQEITAYLAIARGIACTPAQVLVTGGYAGAMGLAIRALGLEGTACWMEEPGFPITRIALDCARVTPVPVPVDADGLIVAEGLRTAPDAALAVVTPGQQAPLGVALSLPRRRALIDWAAASGAWIIEDDYLSELQLKGRAAPALAAIDRAGRVIHIGTFSKTISPALRLGFVVVPQALARHFADVAACLAPAPGATGQRAVAEFMRDGHYLRHLRRMKRLYARRRDALKATLGALAPAEAMAGLAILLRLPDGARDVDIARAALGFGLAPVPLSPWYALPQARSAGLLLSVTNVAEGRLADACARLGELIRTFG
jgi:GntR family transcriptional regulator/MocR family aminotransferase